MMYRLVLAAAVVGMVGAVVPQQCSVSTSCSSCFYEEKMAKLVPTTSTSQPYYAIGGLFNLHHKGTDAFICNATVDPKGLLHTEVSY
jgi:hypothetical protein